MSSDASEHIYRRYEDQLSQLRERLLGMGGYAEQRVRSAIEALVRRDPDLAMSVVTGDEPLNALHKEIDDHCFKLLALRQPLAVDLRTILAAVKINTDLERIGDLAVNIGEAVCRYLNHSPVKALIDIPRMAALAEQMLRDALDSYLRRDAALAQSVLERDSELDGLKEQVFRELLTYMLQSPQTVEPSLDLILISRHLERIGDHATNIAEDVIFVVLARDVRHHAPPPGASG
jgi:phosphate transport system protein